MFMYIVVKYAKLISDLLINLLSTNNIYFWFEFKLSADSLSEYGGWRKMQK
jgi:hypothetical protein